MGSLFSSFNSASSEEEENLEKSRKMFDSVNNEDESNDDNYGFSLNPDNQCSGKISDLGTCDIDSDI